MASYALCTASEREATPSPALPSDGLGAGSSEPASSSMVLSAEGEATASDVPQWEDSTARSVALATASMFSPCYSSGVRPRPVSTSRQSPFSISLLGKTLWWPEGGPSESGALGAGDAGLLSTTFMTVRAHGTPWPMILAVHAVGCPGEPPYRSESLPSLARRAACRFSPAPCREALVERRGEIVHLEAHIIQIVHLEAQVHLEVLGPT